MLDNEQQLNSQTDIIKFTSNYEYILGATMGRAVDISGLFHSANFLASEIDQIAYDLEDVAKMFAAQQGLSPGSPGAYGEPITGNLYNNIKGVRTGQTAHLQSNARDEYGRFYGGHVEFGHSDVPARPHLRPALHAVSQASQGYLRSALYDLLRGGFNGEMPSVFGKNTGRGASYYKGGPGQISKYMTTGTRGRRMKYTFSHNSRAQRKFKKSFNSTAKKTMKWKKQKSLNQTQRHMYRRQNIRRDIRRTSQKFTNRLTKAGYSKNGLQTQKARLWKSYSNGRTKAKTQRFSRQSQRRYAGMKKLRNDRLRPLQLTNYYSSYAGNGYNLKNYETKTGIHSQSYTQSKNHQNSVKTKENNDMRDRINRVYKNFGKNRSRWG